MNKKFEHLVRGILLLGVMSTNAWARFKADSDSNSAGCMRQGYVESSQGWLPLTEACELSDRFIISQGQDHVFDVAKSSTIKIVPITQTGKKHISMQGDLFTYQDTVSKTNLTMQGCGEVLSESSQQNKLSGQRPCRDSFSFASCVTSKRTIYVDLNTEQTSWAYHSFDFNHQGADPSLAISSGTFSKNENEYRFSFHNKDYGYVVVIERPDAYQRPQAHIEIARDDNKITSTEACEIATWRVHEIEDWQNRFKPSQR